MSGDLVQSPLVTTTLEELKTQPRQVQRIYRMASLPASVIPVALKDKPNDKPEAKARKQADRLIWAITVCAIFDSEDDPMAEALMIAEGAKHVSVISGASVTSAEAQRYIALNRRGCDIEIVSQDDQHATVRGRRGSADWSTVTYTRMDALRAGYFDISYKTGWGDDEREWKERWFDLITEKMVENPEKPPAWVAGAKRSWKENYYRQPTTMFLARASTMLTRIISPIPTIKGVPMRVDESLDVANAERVALEGRSLAALDVDSTDVGEDADEVLEGELVEDTPADASPSVDPWPVQWSAAVKAAGYGAEESAAFMRFASEGSVSRSVDLEDQDRPLAETALDNVMAGRWHINAGQVIEEAAA